MNSSELHSEENFSSPLRKKNLPLSVKELREIYNSENYDYTEERELITKPESLKLWPLNQTSYIETTLYNPEIISKNIKNISLVEEKNYSLPVFASWLIPFFEDLYTNKVFCDENRYSVIEYLFLEDINKLENLIKKKDVNGINGWLCVCLYDEKNKEFRFLQIRDQSYNKELSSKGEKSYLQQEIEEGKFTIIKNPSKGYIIVSLNSIRLVSIDDLEKTYNFFKTGLNFNKESWQGAIDFFNMYNIRQGTYVIPESNPLY
jgi:hypothetical protein